MKRLLWQRVFDGYHARRIYCMFLPHDIVRWWDIQRLLCRRCCRTWPMGVWE